MRAKISDKNKFPDFNLKREHKKIEELFANQRIIGECDQGIGYYGDPMLSYSMALDQLFLEWDLRGSFTSQDEMIHALEISPTEFHFQTNEERVLDYIQFVLNAVRYIDKHTELYGSSLYVADKSIRKALMENCYLLLDKLNADTDFDDKEIFVVYKDDVADAVPFEHPDIEPSIVDYLKIDNRGDIEQKRSILRSLATRLEAEERTLLGTEFKSLCEDTTFLLNKFAKHYMDPKDKTAEKIHQMDDDEIEAWCDKTFHMFLACKAAVPYVEMKKEVKGFKAQ